MHTCTYTHYIAPSHTALHYTALHFTVFALHFTVLHRTPLHTTVQDGLPPLIIAAEEGHTKVVTILLDRGADVNAANKVTEQYNELTKCLLKLTACVLKCDRREYNLNYFTRLNN